MSHHWGKAAVNPWVYSLGHTVAKRFANENVFQQKMWNLKFRLVPPHFGHFWLLVNSPDWEMDEGGEEIWKATSFGL